MNPPQASQEFIGNRFGEQVLYEVNRSTFDTVGSQTLFTRHFEQLFSLPDTLFIILGTDSGLLPKWIAGLEHAPSTRFVFVELAELVQPIRAACGSVLEDAGFALTTLDDWRDLIDDFRFNDYAYLGRIKVVASLGARDANLPEYRLLESGLAIQLAEFEQSIQMQLGHHAFLRRQLENIADHVFPAKLLENSQPGATAVLLGGGPSLDEILPWVEQHREQVTVIAVSRIARRLLQSRLEPDIVVSIDPHPVSFDVSKEALRFPSRPLLVCSDHVSPLLLGQWPGPAVYHGDRFPWPTPANGNNLERAGPTVTNLALALAMDMGFSRVILGGVDLCYSPQGYTHASASSEHDVGPKLGLVGKRVQTNGGRLAETSSAFHQAIETMGAQAARAAEHGCSIVNPFADAARIENIGYIPLDELDLSDLPPGQTPDFAKQILRDQEGERHKQLKTAHKELAWARNQLNQVRKLCREALECNERLFGSDELQPDFKYKKRMDRIERRLDREFVKITKLLKSFAATGFLGLLRPNRGTDWSDEEIHAWGQSYYRIYLDAVDRFEKIITDTQERVGARQEELADAPDLERMLAQWRRDDTPGRALHYRQNHPDTLAQAAPGIRSAFEELERAFDRTLTQTETAHAKGLRNAHALAPVRSKLLIQLQQRDTRELQRMSLALQKQDNGEAQELAALARGYLAELEDRPEDAIAQYQFVVDRASEALARDPTQALSARVEDALRRMVYLSLEERELDSAIAGLNALSSLSPTYEPQYAEVLRMAGRLQEAVDVYTDYLSKVPSDITTMMKLGRLLQDAGAIQAARESYNYVLSISPDNQAANVMLASLDEAHS